MVIWMDHLAILTRSLEGLRAQLPKDLLAGEVEEQPGEGTREQYFHFPGGTGPSLLLLQAIRPGPYQRALEKRGPGMHHLGCLTAQMDPALGFLAKQGLLLHPISLKTYCHRAVWLCRPGVPYLIELIESGQTREGEIPIEIEIPRPTQSAPQTFSPLPGLKVIQGGIQGIRIRMGGGDFTLHP